MNSSRHSQTINILSIWHAAGLEAYRDKYRELAKYDDINLTVLAPRYYKTDMPYPVKALPTEEDQSYKFFPAPALFTGKAVLHFYPKLFSYLKKFKPDVVELMEEPYSLITFLTIWWLKNHSPQTRIFVYTYQNIFKVYPQPFRWTEKYVLNHTDHLLIANQECETVFKQKGYKGPVTLIPAGINIKPFEEKNITPLYKKTSNSFIIGYCGRLVEEKGITDLIKALSNLPDHFQLLLIGEGNYKHVLEEEAKKLFVLERVHFKGSVKAVDMPKALRSLDCLVLPSRTRKNWKEQFGRVLIEAMASEVPVIGSDSGEIPGTIGDAGLIFPEGDFSELTKQIKTISDNNKIKEKLVESGRLRAKFLFSHETIEKKLHSIFTNS